MLNKKQEKPETRLERVALTARLTIAAYEAISELQRQHRRKTRKALPIWKVIDTAIKAYAKQQGVQVED